MAIRWFKVCRFANVPRERRYLGRIGGRRIARVDWLGRQADSTLSRCEMRENIQGAHRLRSRAALGAKRTRRSVGSQR